MNFTEREITFLGEQRLGRIATCSPDAEPDVAPVTFRLTSDGRIEIDGRDNPRTLKWRNVLRTGRAAFVVDDLVSIDPWGPRGLKFTGAASAETDTDGRRVIRLVPETIWSWGINPDAPKHFAGVVEKRSARQEAVAGEPD